MISHGPHNFTELGTTNDEKHVLGLHGIDGVAQSADQGNKNVPEYFQEQRKATQHESISLYLWLVSNVAVLLGNHEEVESSEFQQEDNDVKSNQVEAYLVTVESQKCDVE